MITVNGTTWTDIDETNAIFDIMYDKIGKDVARPECHHCRSMTCYIVEPYVDKAYKEGDDGKPGDPRIKPTRPGVAAVMNLTMGSVHYHEGQLYIPARLCLDCGAKREAGYQWKIRDDRVPDLSTRCMSRIEKEKFARVFKARYMDLDRGADLKARDAKKKYVLPSQRRGTQ